MPGDMVRRYANIQGWPITSFNIMVEGEHDARYFALAARLYFDAHGQRLLSPTLAAFPAGIGDEGGVDGIQHHFHPLRKMIEIDVGPDLRPLFSAIALFDSDSAGKRGFEGLAARHLHYRKWRDVFLLQRVLPRSTQEPDHLSRRIEMENERWRHLDCEIEDLISVELVDAFAMEEPRALRKRVEAEGEVHYEFDRGYKSKLARFVEDYATLKDMAKVVETLKSLRYYLRLAPDGV